MAELRASHYLLALIALFVAQDCLGATSYPPTIIQQATKKQVVYEIGDSLQLPCVADGLPTPSYRWEFNGREFDPDGLDGRVTQLQGVGTLLWSNPRSQDEGFYICFAENTHGIAVANTIQMINASLGSFPESNNNVISRIAGEPLRIICPRPVSFPEADIIWSKRLDQGYVPIDYNDRITIDPDGGLNFAYVDSGDDGSYKCSANNRFLRKQVNSQAYPVQIRGAIGDTRSPPKQNWIARTSETFVRGQEARIKCVFSGRPVPGVIWKRPDGKPLSVRAQVRSYGLELYFASIEYEDTGNYECNAYNEAGSNPTKATVIVDVLGHMTWVTMPEPITKGKGENATFVCKGEGRPTPELPKWFKNSERIRGNSDKITIGDDYGPGTTLTVHNLSLSDTMALQCNITNGLRGSWVHTSFYINVQSEKPTIVDFDEGPHKWAAGQSYNLTCKVFGAPTPIIAWKKDQRPLTGGRFIKHDDNTLQINNVGITDAGSYECSATNSNGATSQSTEVVVRRRTQIQQAPEDLTVTARTQAKFVCTALTDPDEAQNLEVRWLKDGSPINYIENNRVFNNIQDNSLQIAGPIALDSGLYTCQATNGIDTAEESATLRVQDRPDHPPSVAIEYCQAMLARIKWSPGANNNAPLTGYVIQYQIAMDKSMWYTAVDNVPDGTTQYDVRLKPNNRYWFRVLSQNKIGISEPSNPTSDYCETNEAVPTINPRGVRTLDEGDDRLVITWQPISPIDFGASSFFYVTKYKRDDRTSCDGKDFCEDTQQAQEGSLGRPGELNIIEYKTIVFNQPTYTKYKITVISRNSIGDSSATISYIYGYSGESNPKQTVTGLKVATSASGQQMIYSDNATLVWNAVTDEGDQETQGFFRGYIIQYTKDVEDGEFFDTRSMYIILRDVKDEGKNPSQRRKLVENEYSAVEHEDGTVSVTLDHLPPNSLLKFQIGVINKRRYGTLSPTPALEVTTKEGVPGPVQQLRISENGPTHIRLTWERPLEPNGVLTKYLVGYKTLDGLHLGPMQYPDNRFLDAPSDPTATQVTAKVTGLKPLQMYRFYVWGYTAVGQGSTYFIDDYTVAAGYPGAPTISVVRLEDNTLNVSWTPSQAGVPANVYYVQYKQESAIDQWQRTGWETNKNYLIVDNFADGWKYEVRVVASNGGIYETASESEMIFPTAVSRSAAEAKSVFSSAWFIGILLALLLIAAFLGMLYYTKKNQGGFYFSDFAPEEAERLNPHDDSVFDEKSARLPDYPDETPVSERYAPSHFSERYAPSQHSERYVGSQPPPHDEYMQDDANRYGEEASFIGQYRANRELPNVRSNMPSRPVQPQPRARTPSDYPSNSSAPIANPRGGYTPTSESSDRYGPRQPAPRQPAPRTPRYPPSESSNDYRPQYRPQHRQPPAASYQPDSEHESHTDV